MTAIADFATESPAVLAMRAALEVESRRRAAREARRRAALAQLHSRVMPLPGRQLHAVPDYLRAADPELPQELADPEAGHPRMSEHDDQPELERPSLTDREVEVLCTWLLLDSKQAAAGKLEISLGTVNTHLTRIRAKYAAVGRPAGSKAALVARAIQDGMLDLDEL